MDKFQVKQMTETDSKVENLSRPITNKEIELVIKNLHTGPSYFIAQYAYM